MTDDEKWLVLQKEADRNAKKKMLAEFLLATGLDEYIEEVIERHEQQLHNES